MASQEEALCWKEREKGHSDKKVDRDWGRERRGGRGEDADRQDDREGRKERREERGEKVDRQDKERR